MKMKSMDLNKETAMRLWSKTFGKETKAIDFAGRKITKGSYGDRNSKFGWNVDHVLPVSQGGKTNDSNLVITHILTNDEKADSFPCFAANNIKFEIIKVQSHYEIQRVDKSSNVTEDNSDVNYFDSASGIRYFKKLKGIQNQKRFVGTILIRLKNLSNTAVVDFIENLFDKENISYSLKNDYYKTETLILAKNYNLPNKSDINDLLDKCVLLNTYLSAYFCKMGYVDAYEIGYRVDFYDKKTDMYIDSQKIDILNLKPEFWSVIKPFHKDFENTLFINDLVIINSDASNDVDVPSDNRLIKYDYYYTKLYKNLEKEVNRE